MKSAKWSTYLQAVPLLFASHMAAAFDSGSSGIDQVFNPTVSTQVQVPQNGVLNYTEVTIPSGVTVTFARNATNTPVTILASGNVTIDGVIDLSGSAATNSGASGDGNLGDDRIPGAGGPGGYDGGFGGFGGGSNFLAGNGLGPGGGTGSAIIFRGGGGGGFGTNGGNANFGGSGGGGSTYGAETLLPLIGGSGGAGGTGGGNFDGAGGGGGGGAILIAASGILEINGTIRANGGTGGSASGDNSGAGGGGGSGGAIRLVATTITGNGVIQATGGTRGFAPSSRNGGNGGAGRVRLEAEIFQRTSSTNPSFTFGAPGDVFVAGLPALSITSVAGVPTPAQPTGNADITLPATTPNPVAVEFQTTGVPVGNTVTLQVAPRNGTPTNVVSDALAGTEASATASVLVDLPEGASTLSATVSFTVTAALGDLLKNFAEGERVERVELAAVPGQGSTTTLITASGKRYTWPSNAVAMN